MNYLGDYYKKKHYRLRIVSSLKFFGKSLAKNSQWSIGRIGRIGRTPEHSKLAKMNKTSSNNRYTFSAEYSGK